jgi:hypothetical protein
MSLLKRSNVLPQRGWRRTVAGLLAAGVGLAVLGLGLRHLGGELGALWQDGAFEEPTVAAGPSLPVDGPAVSVARTNYLSAAGAQAVQQAAAPETPELLDDASFVQFTTEQSPFFFFPAPNGFDFFNPLFTMNFGSGSPVVINEFNFFFGSTGSSTTTPTTPLTTTPGVAVITTSPFGFPVGGTTNVIVFSSSFSQPGAVTVVQVVALSTTFHRHLVIQTTIIIISPLK